jgi:hypothetical protein
MMSPGTFKVYAIRCSDGRVERHALARRSRLDLALMEADRKDVTSSRCGPHSVVEATVTMTEWEPAQDPLGEVEVAEKSVRQIKAEVEMRYCPKCDAMIGNRCENLSVRKREGRVQYTTWPHAERFETGETRRGDIIF